MGGAGGTAEVYDPASGAWDLHGQPLDPRHAGRDCSPGRRPGARRRGLRSPGRAEDRRGVRPGIRRVVDGTAPETKENRADGNSAALRARAPRGRTHVASTLLFDAAALAWSSAGKLSAGRRGHTANFVGRRHCPHHGRRGSQLRDRRNLGDLHSLSPYLFGDLCNAVIAMNEPHAPAPSFPAQGDLWVTN